MNVNVGQQTKELVDIIKDRINPPDFNNAIFTHLSIDVANIANTHQPQTNIITDVIRHFRRQGELPAFFDALEAYNGTFIPLFAPYRATAITPIPGSNFVPAPFSGGINIARLSGILKVQYEVAAQNLNKARYLKDLHKALQRLEYDAYRPIRQMLDAGKALDIGGPEIIRYHHSKAIVAIGTLEKHIAGQNRSASNLCEEAVWLPQLKDATLALGIFVEGIIPFDLEEIPKMLAPSLLSKSSSNTQRKQTWGNTLKSLFSNHKPAVANPRALAPEDRLLCAEQAMKIYKNILLGLPTQLDTSIATFAKVAGLKDLVDSIFEVCKELQQNIPPPPGIQQWQADAGNLLKLGRELEDLVNEHRSWQRSDNIRWSTETNPTLASVRLNIRPASNNYIQPLSEALQSIKDEIARGNLAHSSNLLRILKDLEEAIALGRHVEIPVYYTIFRNTHSDGFSNCDERFAKNCADLCAAGIASQSLSPIPI